MENKVLDIINQIRLNKALGKIEAIELSHDLRKDIGFSSFDLAELTVRVEDEFGIDIFEDGIISTVGEIFERLKK